jgi:hypothetical protein
MKWKIESITIKLSTLNLMIIANSFHTHLISTIDKAACNKLENNISF